jgi:hypothetical protein
VVGRPAYRHLSVDKLAHAVTLAVAVESGEADLTLLNHKSLVWRGKR